MFIEIGEDVPENLRSASNLRYHCGGNKVILPFENCDNASAGVSHVRDFISCPSTLPSTGLSASEHSPRKKYVSNRFGIILGEIHLAY